MLTANVLQIYEHGARNFLIVSTPCMEESPTVRMRDIDKSFFTLGGQLVDFNGHLAFLAHQFAETHRDASVFFFDSYTLGIRVRGDPTAYPETSVFRRMEGFCWPYAERKDELDTDDARCGDRLVNFYWRDGEHQTEPYHRLIARLMVELMEDERSVSCPSSGMTL